MLASLSLRESPCAYCRIYGQIRSDTCRDRHTVDMLRCLACRSDDAYVASSLTTENNAFASDERITSGEPFAITLMAWEEKIYQ
jgi:hypothetical protein